MTTKFSQSELEVIHAVRGAKHLPYVKKIKAYPKNYVRHTRAIESLKAKGVLYVGKHDSVLHFVPAARTALIKAGIVNGLMAFLNF